ncbi:hypothetical protein niasHS_006854 [Heterodera schachtii]|uniref:PPM-type phosphatase domain-containing protein n=1 Tax=Heterodera schachtii TaxID=97005 RepID=A0ABD2JIL0_HETSC
MSAFLRRRMRGLLRTTFSAANSTDTVSSFGGTDEQQQQQFHCDEVEEELMLMMKLNVHKNGVGPSSESATVYERILNGKNGRRVENEPEVYSGKTGLDLPTIHLDKFETEVKACHTGPDGGLTKVQPIRQRAIATMAKLDDEEFSLSSLDEDETTEAVLPPSGRSRKGKRRAKNSLSRTPNDSFEMLDIIDSKKNPEKTTTPRSFLGRYDWNNWDEAKAYGLSTSLYEKHPVTGLSAGHPIADVFGIIARENNSILALADGVNWGEGARLAARCAIRGAIEQLNLAIERDSFKTTNDVFHCLLGSFHAAHALILQEGGALTTLCVALVAPVRASSSFVLCACNVGDSLCFVFDDKNGVREVTLASHDIGQMRDMRDAGGALGPVDGRNPQLQNLTCSMTFVRDGDLVFITSDGISDNFDPVVGKFCVMKRSLGDSNEKENIVEATDAFLPPKPTQLFHKTKSAPPANGLLHFSLTPNPQLRSMVKRPAAILPSVGAMERHELMLLRMSDVISNGLGNHRPDNAFVFPTIAQHPNEIKPTNAMRSSNPLVGLASSGSSTTACSSLSGKDDDEQQLQKCSIDAATLCRNLIRFSYQLSAAKRRTLEDPELYRMRTHSKTEERLRRKVVRDMIMEMPGKLDHASVVAYKVGKWPRHAENHLLRRRVTEWEGGMELDGVFMERHGDREPNDEDDGGARIDDHPPQSCREENPFQLLECQTEKYERINGDQRVFRQHQKREEEKAPKNTEKTQQKTEKIDRRRHHGRGSEARHTLGVDVSWLKRLVTSKHEQKEQQQQMGINEVNGSGCGEVLLNGQPQANCNGKCPKGWPSANGGLMKNGDNYSMNFSLRKLRLFGRPQQQPIASVDNELQHQRHTHEKEGTEQEQLDDQTTACTDQQNRQHLASNGAVKTAAHPPTVPRMGLGQLITMEDGRHQQDYCESEMMAANGGDEPLREREENGGRENPFDKK